LHRVVVSDAAPWPRIAVLGAGAVGGYFGALLAHAGAPVIFIGRPAFVSAVSTHGLELDALQLKTHVRVAATSDINACRDADLVLFCVKTVDTERAARALAPALSPLAQIAVLQNGVEGAAQVRSITARATLATVVYVAASMPEPGRIAHVGRGDLIVGPDDRQARAFAQLCERAAIGCRISDNIRGEQWIKLLLNCALNAASALARANYGHIVADPDGRAVVAQLVAEFMAVAAAERIELPGIASAQEGLSAALRLASQMPAQRSSTAQDLEHGRPTEIDSLNGFIVRRAAVHGVAAPVNQALYALVKLLEANPKQPGKR